MRRFGSKVTIIDRNGRLMAKEDPDVCEVLRSLLADEGIDILLNARINEVSGTCGDSVSVVVELSEHTYRPGAGSIHRIQFDFDLRMILSEYHVTDIERRRDVGSPPHLVAAEFDLPYAHVGKPGPWTGPRPVPVGA